MNYLYLGDCFNVLRENIKDESVDLIYIDPPFNSKRDYNIFFDDKEIHTQRIAFEDTWTLKSIQDSLGAMEKHKCALGVFLTIENPTKPMMQTVAASGFVDVPGFKYPKLQILTLKDYFQNKQLKLPAVNVTFKAATKKGKKQQQEELNL